MKESGPDGRFGAVGSQIAASNERLLEVSDKRITSFVGFQEISGDVSAHSASPSQRPVRRGGGSSSVQNVVFRPFSWALIARNRTVDPSDVTGLTGIHHGPG